MAKGQKLLWTDFFKGPPNDRQRLRDRLAQNILFSTLNPRELAFAAGFIYERHFQPGEEIFSQDDRGFGMYLIFSGTVSVRTRSNAGPITIAALGPGSFFGELSLLDPDALRNASVIATEPTHLAGLFKSDLNEIIQGNPETGIKLLTQLAYVLGQRLHEATELVTDLEAQLHAYRNTQLPST